MYKVKNLKDIMPREISQSPRDKCCMSPFICGTVVRNMQTERWLPGAVGEIGMGCFEETDFRVLQDEVMEEGGGKACIL